MKKVTVIIAAYRATAFIQEAVFSILDQEMPASYQLQLILGVDGCDATRQAVLEIRDKRVQVFNMDRNYGTYVTFNTMMQFAKGELVVRFDADDVMLAGFLRKQIEVFDQQADVCLTWTLNRYIDIEGQAIQSAVNNDAKNLKYWEIRSPSQGQFMMRKALWLKLGSFRSWPCNSDTDFLKRMRFLGLKEHGIHEELYLRRIHPGSLTQSNTTGYDSDLRQRFVDIMNKQSVERLDNGECWVKPIVGGFEDITDI